MNEDALVRTLRRRLARDDDPRVEVGIGDDGAVLAPLEGASVLSVDAQVEEVHFRRGWLAMQEVAERGVTAALSDLAAMGADAVAVLISWELPADDPDETLEALIEGLAGASARYAVPVVGGNVSRGPALSQHTTVLGALRGPALLRSGARPGDGVFTTGPLGAVALGLRELLAEDAGAFADRWRRPRARLDRVSLVRAHATSCIDVSDGLRSELGHVCAASGVGAIVELAEVPVAEGFAARARALGEDPESLIAGGGEDYELLFTSGGAPDPQEATRIGTVTENRAIVLRRADGTPWEGEAGFRHR